MNRGFAAELFIFASGICFLIGTLTIAIIVAGFFLGAILTVLIPVAVVFTGLGLLWWGSTDYDKEATGSE